jgi:hypothetical protein
MLTGRGILRQALGAEQANAVPLNFPMRKSPLFLTVNLSTPCLRFVSFFFLFSLPWWRWRRLTRGEGGFIRIYSRICFPSNISYVLYILCLAGDGQSMRWAFRICTGYWSSFVPRSILPKGGCIYPLGSSSPYRGDIDLNNYTSQKVRAVYKVLFFIV